MIYINDREVSTYFKDKNCVKNLNCLMKSLYLVACNKMGFEDTPSTMVHLTEAVALYLHMNRSEKIKTVSNKRLHKIVLMFHEGDNNSGLVDILVDRNIEPSKACVQKLIKSNSNLLNEELDYIYSFYEEVMEVDLCKYCQYCDALTTIIMWDIEQFSLETPLSMTLISELMHFCMKNSRIANLSKTDKEAFFNEHE